MVAPRFNRKTQANRDHVHDYHHHDDQQPPRPLPTATPSPLIIIITTIIVAETPGAYPEPRFASLSFGVQFLGAG